MKSKSLFKINIEKIQLLSLITLFLSFFIFIFCLSNSPTGVIPSNWVTVSLSFFILVFSWCNLFVLHLLLESSRIRNEILKLEWSYTKFMFPPYLIIVSFLVMLNPTLISFPYSLEIEACMLGGGIMSGFVFIMLYYLRKFIVIIYKFSKNSKRVKCGEGITEEDLHISFYLITTYFFGIFLGSMLFLLPIIGIIHWIFI